VQAFLLVPRDNPVVHLRSADGRQNVRLELSGAKTLRAQTV
jgi:hypothetical protein